MSSEELKDKFFDNVEKYVEKCSEKGTSTEGRIIYFKKRNRNHIKFFNN